jgi:hypothetical protein
LSLSTKSSSSFSPIIIIISFVVLFLLRNRALLSIHQRITSTWVKTTHNFQMSTNTNFFTNKNEMKEVFDVVSESYVRRSECDFSISSLSFLSWSSSKSKSSVNI